MPREEGGFLLQPFGVMVPQMAEAQAAGWRRRTPPSNASSIFSVVRRTHASSKARARRVGSKRQATARRGQIL